MMKAFRQNTERFLESKKYVALMLIHDVLITTAVVPGSE
jgi:hypothetical protein